VLSEAALADGLTRASQFSMRCRGRELSAKG
jgi:hypothetical protein